MEHAANSSGAWSQTGGNQEEANRDVLNTFADSGINKHVLTHPQPDINLPAELSFRIDFPGEMIRSPYTTDTFGVDSIIGSSNMLFGNGIDSGASFAPHNFAHEGDVGNSALQYKTPMSLKQNADDIYFTSFGQVDVGKENMWNNRGPGVSELDAWMPGSKKAESRVPGLANADYVDERLMKFGGREFSSLSCKGRELQNFSIQDDEPDRKFWLSREFQNQALSSRKLSKSVNGSHNNMDGYHLERASTCPRVGPFFNREEDLYSSQGMLSSHKNNYKTQHELRAQQRAPHLEKELYPVMSPMINYRLAAAHNQGYAVNSMALRKGDMESHRAAFEGAMTKYAPNYSNLPIRNPRYEGSFTGPSDYAMHSFGGPYDHPHARFQERNGQFSGDSYSLQMPSCDGAYVFPKPSHQLTGPPLASQRDMSRDSKCTCCKEHAHIQPPSHTHSSFGPHPYAATLTQYPPLGYQNMQTHAHYKDHSTYGKFPSLSSQNSLPKLHARRKAADALSQVHLAVLARKENCPPLPGPGAPPYVLCQGCDKVVQVPVPLHVESAVLKLRCGACRRVSKFCNIVHPCYQALLKEGGDTGSMQRACSSDSLNKEKLLSTAATAGTIEKNAAAQVPMSVKVNDDFRSSSVVGGQHDKQIVAEANGTSNGVEKFDAFTSKMVLEQEANEREWRGGNSFRPWSRSGTLHEDSSSLFSVSGSVSTKNTAGHESHESQQVETSSDLVLQSIMPEEGVQAKVVSIAVDSPHEQSDSRLLVPSEELQGLMLECLQDCSYDDLKGKAKASIIPQSNQFHEVEHDEPACMSNDNNQRLVGSLPRKQVHHLKENKPGRLSNNSYESFMAPREQIEHHNLQSTEVSCDRENSAPTRPVPGSPLYEYLSYDTSSEIGTDLKTDVEGKQAVAAPSVQDISKGSNFLTSFFKKNIQQGNHKNLSVVVNGMTIPRHAIRSAEKQAGTIRPGVYWYDYQAGFWGVMGGPCLGIIPPCIAEFKLPLARNCAGGTTGVIVNGRELHKKDLDALAGRGLPRTAGNAYMVDISGQVVDKSSGQVLRSLGRLAPTVQKRGRGCGMFQPPTLS